MTLIQRKQKRAAREQRNKYKPRTETSTNQEQKQEQHFPIKHAGRPADYIQYIYIYMYVCMYIYVNFVNLLVESNSVTIVVTVAPDPGRRRSTSRVGLGSFRRVPSGSSWDREGFHPK